MLPSLANQGIALIKDTSLAYVVGVTELTMVATQVNNRVVVYPTEIFLAVAALYFVLCYGLSLLTRYFEGHRHRHFAIAGIR
jgi:polar amino acid transport system permease protein